MAKASGYRALRFDILDNKKPRPGRKTNFLDLNTASGFAFLGMTDHVLLCICNIDLHCTIKLV